MLSSQHLPGFTSDNCLGPQTGSAWFWFVGDGWWHWELNSTTCDQVGHLPPTMHSQHWNNGHVFQRWGSDRNRAIHGQNFSFLCLTENVPSQQSNAKFVSRRLINRLKHHVLTFSKNADMLLCHTSASCTRNGVLAWRAVACQQIEGWNLNVRHLWEVAQF